jgi:hypothetical protein
MKKIVIFFGCVLACMATFGQQKTEPVKLVKQEVIDGKKVCHYADGSKITTRNAIEICPDPWRLLN